jgi:hypothetical protein
MGLYQGLAGVVDALNEAGIDDAVCGGMAVAMHGYARLTKDIDLLVRREDVERILELAAPLGFDLPVARLRPAPPTGLQAREVDVANFVRRAVAVRHDDARVRPHGCRQTAVAHARVD